MKVCILKVNASVDVIIEMKYRPKLVYTNNRENKITIFELQMDYSE
jgi:hypothetical protein